MVDTPLVRSIYPLDDDDLAQGRAFPGYGVGDYRPLLLSFGPVILAVDDNDYSGDSRVLYRVPDPPHGIRYGILIFGWGSCSGCDALQACGTYEDVEALRDELESQIRWGTKHDTLTYLREHDWKGDYIWAHDTEAIERFVSGSITFLEQDS